MLMCNRYRESPSRLGRVRPSCVSSPFLSSRIPPSGYTREMNFFERGRREIPAEILLDFFLCSHVLTPFLGSSFFRHCFFGFFCLVFFVWFLFFVLTDTENSSALYSVLRLLFRACFEKMPLGQASPINLPFDRRRTASAIPDNALSLAGSVTTDLLLFGSQNAFRSREVSPSIRGFVFSFVFSLSFRRFPHMRFVAVRPKWH